ncbi:MAG: extracellular solute-binding protein [Eubacterium sp.]|nr:extracellular solute-binding protein [Eubacterium sp.]
MKELIKKISALGLAITMTAGAFTGCNSGEGSSSSVSEKNTITWMSMLHTQSPPADSIVEKLAGITGVDGIEFQWIPDASKDEKLNTALASKSLAQIVSLTTVTDNAAIRMALLDGVFWDIEPYIADYPNLAKISKERIDAARIGGKLYGVPFQKPVARYGVLIRQDWLDNLGLPVPHTVEDLIKTSEAFTKDDPDGNGVDDTVGLVERSESFNIGFRMLSGYYGAPNYFDIDDAGKVTPYFLHDGFYKAAEDMRYLYENGYMNSDWLTMPKNDQKEYIARSRGGIVFAGLFEAKNYVNDAVASGQGDTMKWGLINDMVVEGIDRRILSDTNGGFGGLLAMPKSEVADETELRRVLAFIDKLCSKEAFTLMTWGVEGEHFRLDSSGAYERINEEKWMQEVQALSASRPDEMWSYQMPTVDPVTTEANNKMVENEPYAIVNECQSLQSQTYTNQWKSLLIIVQDAYSKYVIGTITMEEFKAEIERWLANGGQAIIDEYEADYASVQNQ